MDTENMIEITGANLIDVAKAAYALSNPQGLGFLHYEDAPLSDEDAQMLVDLGSDRHPLRLDYVKGRSCKLTVHREDDKLFIGNDWYDHSKDELEALLERIQGKPTKNADEVESTELIAVIKVLRQTVMTVRAAQNSGPDWYTKGAKGLYMQVRLHLDRADKAIKSIEPALDE